MAAEGHPAPRPLMEKPDLLLHLIPAWEAFKMLTSSRQIHFGGYGVIPFSEITSFLQWRGIKSMDDQKRMIMHVRTLDIEYLKCIEESRRKEEQENNKNDRPRQQRR